jgi:hypothetical protein
MERNACVRHMMPVKSAWLVGTHVFGAPGPENSGCVEQILQEIGNLSVSSRTSLCSSQ